MIPADTKPGLSGTDDGDVAVSLPFQDGRGLPWGIIILAILYDVIDSRYDPMIDVFEGGR